MPIRIIGSPITEHACIEFCNDVSMLWQNINFSTNSWYEQSFCRNIPTKTRMVWYLLGNSSWSFILSGFWPFQRPSLNFQPSKKAAQEDDLLRLPKLLKALNGILNLNKLTFNARKLLCNKKGWLKNFWTLRARNDQFILF